MFEPACENLVPIDYPPSLVARDGDTISLIDADSGQRHDLTFGQTRRYAYALLALADGLPLTAIPGKPA